MNPAELGNLAARHNLVEIDEACRREVAKSGSYPDRIVRQFYSCVAVSFPLRVIKALTAAGCIDSDRNRTEPSAKATFAPPG